MARFSQEGLNEFLAQVERAGEGTGEVAKAMLMAAAAEVATCWKDSARKHGHRVTGDLIRSIGYPQEPTRVGNVLSIDIYPQGKDSKGVRNAEKAFVLNYGKKGKKGSHFVDEADKKAGKAVQTAMEEVWYKYLNEKGLID